MALSISLYSLLLLSSQCASGVSSVVAFLKLNLVFLPCLFGQILPLPCPMLMA